MHSLDLIFFNINVYNEDYFGSTLSFMLIAIALGAQAAPDVVLDTDGKKLRSGVNYYILPFIRGRGGGITAARVGNKTCPLDVAQDQDEISNGLPLTFMPVDPKKGVIRVLTDHNIKFSAASTCVQSTVWKLDEFDESTGKLFVTTGGVEGNPSIQTLSNWFRIEKYDNDYKLVFCPGVCDFCRPICGDIGIYNQDGYRRL